MSVVKAIIAMEEMMIPPSINYNNPNPNVSALVNGTIKVGATITLLYYITETNDQTIPPVNGPNEWNLQRPHPLHRFILKSTYYIFITEMYKKSHFLVF